ncbi:hypothetical protein [Bartonella heixiaziensis]|uniref:hypothetical protein n=1 Tax=Bartonella heixiaziensis TaxID=1461000 RepID=UPI003D201B54
MNLRNEDLIKAAKFRREGREKFETELANAMDIAESNRQQAISMKKLATVLEKQLELLEEKNSVLSHKIHGRMMVQIILLL